MSESKVEVPDSTSEAFMGEGLGVGSFLVSLAHNGERGESLAKGESSSSKDIGAEDIVW